jgi:hypothetical protein
MENADGLILLARAGGGDDYGSGGGSSSGGSSYSGGGSSSHSFGGGGSSGGSMSFPEIFAMLIFALIIYYMKKKIKGSQQTKGFLQTLDPSLQSVVRTKAPALSTAASELSQKLSHHFVEIQKAWDKGSMDPVRAILSDGVYNRFQIQLEMNRLQGMRNQVEQPILLASKVLSEDTFGPYTSIDFLIRGRLLDTDIRIADGTVLKGGSTTVFEEIWSFTRLAQSESNQNPTATNPGNCPNCAAPLSDAGGSRCGHCGAVLNSGAYDWVLAEITQAEEWATTDRNNLQRYYSQLPEVPGHDAKAWLSPQELEDRASVVFIRYQSALHAGGLGSLNKFVTPELLQALGSSHREPKLYRVAVGAVDLVGFAESQGLVKAWVRVKFAGSEEPNQPGPHQVRIMVFSKSIKGEAGKGHMSSMTCPSCGGPIETSDQAKCAYCDNVLSSPAANWVLSDYGGVALLSGLTQTPSPAQARAGLPHAKSEAGLQKRILSAIVMASLEDRVITPEEETLIREFARNFGMGDIFVDLILKKAKENPEVLAETIDPGLAVIWLNNFIMVAANDNRITPGEEALLLSFARRNGIAEKQVRFAMQAALKIKI